VKTIFETSDLDLAAYLMLHELKLIGARIEIDPKQRRPKAIMQFADEKHTARDLERLFQTSSEKRYRDCMKYLLKEAHTAVREYANKALEDEET
jgi:hypothetical protein